jgi:hypothetical protein
MEIKTKGPESVVAKMTDIEVASEIGQVQGEVSQMEQVLCDFNEFNYMT